MLLSQFFRHVYRSRKYIGDNTAVTYLSAINRFHDWHKKPVLLSRLTPDLVRAFLRDYRRDASPASVNGKRQVILTLWRWAYRWGKTPNEPPEDHEIPKLPTPKRAPKAWTVEQFSRVLECCTVAKPLCNKSVVWDHRHWRALFLTIYDTGERLQALLKTERCDLAASGHLTIRGEHRKGKQRDIVRKLHHGTVQAISELPPHRLLFPWPITRRAIWREVEPILMAAGITPDRRNKFHCGRRTSATQVAVALGPAAAQRHLDHSSLALTIGSYIDPSQLPAQDAADVITRPF